MINGCQLPAGSLSRYVKENTPTTDCSPASSVASTYSPSCISSPSDTRPSRIDGYFTGQGGINIHYSIYKPELSRPGSSRNLVIVPGRSDPADRYQDIAEDMTRQGFTVFTLDHRGQGKSDRLCEDRLKGHVTDFNDYILDLKTFMDDFVKPSESIGTFLLSHSMGALISSLYDIDHPGQISGMVLSAPMFKINTGSYPEWCAHWIVSALTYFGYGESYIWGCGAINLDQVPFENNYLTTSRSGFNQGKAFLKENPNLMVGAPTNQWTNEALNATQRFRSQCSELKTPCLVLSAQADQVVSPQAHHDVAEQVENVFKLPIENAKHDLFSEKSKVRKGVVKAVRNFFNMLQPQETKQTKKNSSNLHRTLSF